MKLQRIVIRRYNLGYGQHIWVARRGNDGTIIADAKTWHECGELIERQKYRLWPELLPKTIDETIEQATRRLTV